MPIRRGARQARQARRIKRGAKLDKVKRVGKTDHVSGDVKHLLGAFGFVRQWICGSADICDPLFDLLKKGAKFSWGPKQERALEQLRQAATESPCLTQIDPTRPVYCRTDASDIGVACIIYQMIKNAEGAE